MSDDELRRLFNDRKRAAKEFAKTGIHLTTACKNRWPHCSDVWDDHDEVVEPLEYGNGNITFKRFIELLDENEKKYQ